ncbi:MAG: winged helix family transcriptional regulator [Dehalococcoidia bacterium]|nr:winged helix family transcriptional regulator [Dehalococcoidia bacterium]
MNGVDLRCTPLEFAILGHMAALPGQPLPHAFLNARVWNYPNLAGNTLLKGHISALRRKLRAAGAGGMLRTVHGVGYSLSA